MRHLVVVVPLILMLTFGPLVTNAQSSAKAPLDRQLTELTVALFGAVDVAVSSTRLGAREKLVFLQQAVVIAKGILQVKQTLEEESEAPQVSDYETLEQVLDDIADADERVEILDELSDEFLDAFAKETDVSRSALGRVIDGRATYEDALALSTASPTSETFVASCLTDPTRSDAARIIRETLEAMDLEDELDIENDSRIIETETVRVTREICRIISLI